VNRTIKKQVEEFLVSDSFVNYVMDPTISLIERWEQYFRSHPNEIAFANEAKQILLGEGEMIQMPSFEAVELKMKIFEKCNLAVLN